MGCSNANHRQPGNMDYWRDRLNEIEWPEPLSSTASIGATMTPADLRAWQIHMGYTQQQAADALCVSLATYKDWITGHSRTTGKPVTLDKRTALACAAIAAGLSAWTAS